MVTKIPQTFAIKTLGCKVNMFESNAIKNDLLSYGYIHVPFSSKSDIYIINTCSVTNKADSKSRLAIRKAIKTNAKAIIIVAGCMSQIDSQLMQKMNIDIQIGNKYKNTIHQLIQEFLQKKQRIKRIENLFKEKVFETNQSFVFLENTRAFIKIQDGCNFMCSYCIIPFARGKQRSNPIDRILFEVKNLIKKNYKEIVLTGVNIAGYLDQNQSFYDLLVALNNLKGDFRIRISSVEPFQITNEIIELVAKNPQRFCQHWHICIQSGSDNVLKQMNRKYLTGEFFNLIQKIKKLAPETNITTDYIVGFPTETHQDHLVSIAFLNKIGFFDMHIFPYSSRNRTVASKLTEIDGIEKKQRIKEINQICLINKRKILKEFVGKKLEVVFESKTKKSQYYQGYSSQYCLVFVNTKENIAGKKLYVHITKVMYDGLYGEILNN